VQAEFSLLINVTVDSIRAAAATAVVYAHNIPQLVDNPADQITPDFVRCWYDGV
jgi:hypothetical protein